MMILFSLFHFVLIQSGSKIKAVSSFFEALNFNPTSIQRLGQMGQPCISGFRLRIFSLTFYGAEDKAEGEGNELLVFP